MPASDAPDTTGRVASGPGGLLRAAREAARIDLAELARRTRLEQRVLEALEGDEYHTLPATAFVKGYIRSIARALDIDPAPVLTRYAEFDQTEDPGLADFATRSPTEITSSSLIIKVTSAALLVGVLLLIALWWQRSYQATGQTPEELAALSEELATPPPDPGIPLSYDYTIVDHSRDPLGPVRTWRHQTDGSAPPAEEPAALMAADEPAPDTRHITEAPTPEPAPVPEPEPEPEPEPAPEPAAAPPSPNPPVAAQPRTVPPPGETQASGPTEPPTNPEVPPPAPVTPRPPRGVELIVQGRGESWLEVTDSAGKRLFMGTVKPGQRLTMKGRPPYDLVVGFPPAISATFGGSPVDLHARPRDGSVPRFRLDAP
jgi:cytoskeleton protein RodZ